MDHQDSLDRDDERQRLRPTAEGRAQLLAAVAALGPARVVDAGSLGEYAEIAVSRGRAEADARIPAVAAHLAGGCAACADDLEELLVVLASEDPAPVPPPRDAPYSPTPDRAASPHPPTPSSASGRGGDGAVERPDSGFYAGELRDPRADEREAARRQRLHRIRLWLVVAAATSVALIGLSLIGLAYLSSGQAGPARLALTPVPPAAPGQQAPVTAPQGRTAPTGTSCPASHPVKGNRPSMIYHAPGGAFYDQTGPEECFATAADAEAAGYRPSQR